MNLSYLARGLSNESIWDMEDDELLAVARRHLEEWHLAVGRRPTVRSKPDSCSLNSTALRVSRSRLLGRALLVLVGDSLPPVPYRLAWRSSRPKRSTLGRIVDPGSTR